MSYYTNSDGLNIRFGSDRATSSKMGRVSTAGDLQEVVVSFDYSDIGTADDVVGTHPQMGIPNGAYIESAIGVATLVADARIACNGAKINTTIAGTGGRSVYVSTGYNTAAFTAGAADLVIKYRR
jgi:hypothetical protein